MNSTWDRWHDLYHLDYLPTQIDVFYERCAASVDTWSAQAYLILKQQGLNVHFVPREVPGQISIVPYHQLKLRNLPFHSYTVGVQYDCARPEICEQRIVLNQRVVLGQTDHFVHHWPHPLLQVRDRDRGLNLENVVFKGRTRNLAAPFRDPAFALELQQHGIHFCLDADAQDDDAPARFRLWGDYSQADANLAVRDATEKDLLMKPAVKLINGWHAGCPTIVSPEPAYQALYRSELDYIEARSAKEVIAALKQLKAEPGRYAAMIENGFERAKDFTHERLATQWSELLANPIATGYRQWRQQSVIQKVVGRPWQFIQRARQHKREFKQYIDNIHNGPRLFCHSDRDPALSDRPLNFDTGPI
ncbi:MAG: glycosyltransferase [Leptolyngbyaceae cyanobacterium bins.349]|nr:glycosyltransferase [Leptolyngbyaceae cyanobacterium bins.349]